MSNYEQGVKFWIAKTERIDLVNYFVKKKNRSKKLKIDKKIKIKYILSLLILSISLPLGLLVVFLSAI